MQLWFEEPAWSNPLRFSFFRTCGLPGFLPQGIWSLITFLQWILRWISGWWKECYHHGIPSREFTVPRTSGAAKEYVCHVVRTCCNYIQLVLSNFAFIYVSCYYIAYHCLWNTLNATRYIMDLGFLQIECGGCAPSWKHNNIFFIYTCKHDEIIIIIE